MREYEHELGLQPRSLADDRLSSLSSGCHFDLRRHMEVGNMSQIVASDDDIKYMKQRPTAAKGFKAFVASWVEWEDELIARIREEEDKLFVAEVDLASQRRKKFQAYEENDRLLALVNQARNFFTNVPMSPSADEDDDIYGWYGLARAELEGTKYE